MIKILDCTVDDGENYREVIKPSLSSRNVKVGVVTLNSGESMKEHSTMDREEVLYIIRGDGRLESVDSTHPIQEGNIAYISPHTHHSVVNSGEGKLQYIYITSET